MILLVFVFASNFVFTWVILLLAIVRLAFVLTSLENARLQLLVNLEATRTNSRKSKAVYTQTLWKGLKPAIILREMHQ